MNALLSPIPPPSALIEAVVRYDRVASPVMQVADARPVVRQQALAVRDPATRSASRRPGCSRPSGACDRARTSGRPGCRRCCRGGCPAWLPDVIDGRIASQRDSLWLPSRTQPAIVLTEPARIRPARIGWASPSIWMITRPGLSVWPGRPLDQQALDQQPVVRAAAVDAEDRGQDRVDDRVDERRRPARSRSHRRGRPGPTGRRRGTRRPGGRGRGPRPGSARPGAARARTTGRTRR